MAAIALVSAMLGGVFGIAVWRVVATPNSTPRHWYCTKFDDKLTGCERDASVCAKTMERADLPCVAAPFAWCGTHHCTATLDYCLTVSPDNGRCDLRRP
jgi:hypothetical protein